MPRSNDLLLLGTLFGAATPRITATLSVYGRAKRPPSSQQGAFRTTRCAIAPRFRAFTTLTGRLNQLDAHHNICAANRHAHGMGSICINSGKQWRTLCNPRSRLRLHLRGRGHRGRLHGRRWRTTSKRHGST